jgi:hypothetical protein
MMLLDQFCALVLAEPPTQRRRWLAAHRRAVRSRGRERPPPMPPRWRYATVCGGVVTYHALHRVVDSAVKESTLC